MNASLAYISSRPAKLALAALALVVIILVGGAYAVSRGSGEDTPRQTFAVPYELAFGGIDHQFALDGITFTLVGGNPRGEPSGADFISAREGNRIVYFSMLVERPSTATQVLGVADAEPATLVIQRDGVTLRTDHGLIDPILLRVEGVAAPVDVAPGPQKLLEVIFEIGEEDRELELQLSSPSGRGAGAAWTFTHDTP